MKTAKGWRQLKKEFEPTDITREELYEYLKTVFFDRTPPENVSVTPTYWTTEEGVEMVTVVSPMGVMMTRAGNWHKALENESRGFVTIDSNFILGHDPYKDNSEDTPITSTKVTLDHGIEVTITYDGDDA